MKVRCCRVELKFLLIRDKHKKCGMWAPVCSNSLAKQTIQSHKLQYCVDHLNHFLCLVISVSFVPKQFCHVHDYNILHLLFQLVVVGGDDVCW